MPVYVYRCDQCGPYDQRRNAEDSSRPLPCPRCSGDTKRVYTAPAIRSRSTASAAAAGDRIDRARAGEPIVTGAPVGRRIPSTGSHVH